MQQATCWIIKDALRAHCYVENESPLETVEEFEEIFIVDRTAECSACCHLQDTRSSDAPNVALCPADPPYQLSSRTESLEGYAALSTEELRHEMQTLTELSANTAKLAGGAVPSAATELRIPKATAAVRGIDALADVLPSSGGGVVLGVATAEKRKHRAEVKSLTETQRATRIELRRGKEEHESLLKLTEALCRHAECGKENGAGGEGAVPLLPAPSLPAAPSRGATDANGSPSDSQRSSRFGADWMSQETRAEMGAALAEVLRQYGGCESD